MATSNKLYQHVLSPSVSTYIEMAADIVDYLKQRYGDDITTEVKFIRQRWVVWEELEQMALELKERDEEE
ncbi:hypothetical protein BO82DRAFT_405598 [Aspergillus uvarum CBS 121591]|uniref:Uncharacterized protein n=3 Tax=Aspergillus TaxID=5052 RepID=A0A319C2Q5_9EURO|nr:hypothetical protein BO82DRAFT_405598 [Aspergillus uvarum CBS 121591]XP_025527685.1 hypothetical protein BO86DRAFT_399626 [Aspergillus japonicus CBS 114.51]PYH78079.1 hypothetical protein BO82DRAFT_405598 [Aspergillus uvarum CBS 121591]PYI20670.1 hypothetical protein BO99DRAFT_431372 [Aspergillus violaceofuscus CBS 115571]RAH81791.1 hypothetical protein BO86DRAFT_399626 [Aspergillus japonicus CBS 114.51]